VITGLQPDATKGVDMRTAIADLQDALEGLASERLQRLVDRLEHDPGIAVTVGSWLPHCPMVLAGFDPARGEPDCPEQQFAAVWDRFAAPRPRRRWRALVWPAPQHARRADVQFLLRAASATLATRAGALTSAQARRAEQRRISRWQARARRPRSRS
jgi:hypothetical protein